MTAPARPASTVCLLREGESGTEVLMVRRSETARFMGGVWVFPGGVVDEEDGGELARSVVLGPRGDEAPWLAACLRELVEEVGLWITTVGLRTTEPVHDVFACAAADGLMFDGEALACFAHWITPAPLPIRFDTKFYAAHVAGGHEPSYDPEELSDVRWITPAGALQLADRGEWSVAFPTRKALSMLESGTAAAFVAGARGTTVDAVQPRVVVEGGEVRFLLPDDVGFEEAADDEADPEFLARLVAASPGGDETNPELPRP